MAILVDFNNDVMLVLYIQYAKNTEEIQFKYHHACEANTVML